MIHMMIYNQPPGDDVGLQVITDVQYINGTYSASWQLSHKYQKCFSKNVYQVYIYTHIYIYVNVY